MKENDEFTENPLDCVEEKFEVGKVNGVVYKMVSYMKEKSYTEQLILYSAFMEAAENIEIK